MVSHTQLYTHMRKLRGVSKLLSVELSWMTVGGQCDAHVTPPWKPVFMLAWLLQIKSVQYLMLAAYHC